MKGIGKGTRGQGENLILKSKIQNPKSEIRLGKFWGRESIPEVWGEDILPPTSLPKLSAKSKRRSGATSLHSDMRDFRKIASITCLIIVSLLYYGAILVFLVLEDDGHAIPSKSNKSRHL